MIAAFILSTPRNKAKIIYIHANGYKRHTLLWCAGVGVKANRIVSTWDIHWDEMNFRTINHWRINRFVWSGKLNASANFGARVDCLTAENEIKWKQRDKLWSWPCERIQKAIDGVCAQAHLLSHTREYTIKMSWEIIYDIRWILHRWKDRNRITLFTTAFASLPVDVDGKMCTCTCIIWRWFLFSRNILKIGNELHVKFRLANWVDASLRTPLDMQF